MFTPGKVRCDHNTEVGKLVDTRDNVITKHKGGGLVILDRFLETSMNLLFFGLKVRSSDH